ncbi:MAG: endonuclease [Rubellimicrobium sp.]|nr:endonuclease [Rubellimicrobium sp.]
MSAVTCLTWNIHRARGADGRVDPGRIAGVFEDEVLSHGRPDILALTEADAEEPHSHGLLDLPRIERASGLVWIHGPDHLRWSAESHGFLGTILFLSHRFALHHADVIDLPGGCDRGAVVAEVEDSADKGGGHLRIIATHLSLIQPLRIVQMRILAQYLRRRPVMQTILMGDLNEWRPWGGMALHPRIARSAFHGPRTATFPARRPLLPLDRILSDRKGSVTALAALSGPGLRIASDHLPLRAEVATGPRP